MQVICETCGLIEYALVDGYPFGDRALEGVSFKVTFDKKGNALVDTLDDWNSNNYLRGLNKKYWLEQAVDYAESTDTLECSYCHDDIDNPFFNDELGDETVISVITGYDLLSKLVKD